MIFVTVGTHEQPFDRLIKYIDVLKGSNTITEDVIIQTGYSTYHPKHCVGYKLFPYQEMIRKIEQARIVITHGGPSSFLMALQMGKIPIVVPRQRQFGEHINDHQLEFSKIVSERQGTIIVVEDINKLQCTLLDYDRLVLERVPNILNNNKKFNIEFEKIVREIIDF